MVLRSPLLAEVGCTSVFEQRNTLFAPEIDFGEALIQGGRTWQAFGGGKNGHETFRQACIYNFRDKCVIFARNLKFSNLTQ